MHKGVRCQLTHVALYAALQPAGSDVDGVMDTGEPSGHSHHAAVFLTQWVRARAQRREDHVGAAGASPSPLHTAC
jgi:hypothetical protein